MLKNTHQLGDLTFTVVSMTRDPVLFVERYHFDIQYLLKTKPVIGKLILEIEPMVPTSHTKMSWDLTVTHNPTGERIDDYFAKDECFIKNDEESFKWLLKDISDHIYNRYKNLEVSSALSYKQSDPEDTKMKETDQKDTGYNATGNCDSSLIITINDIMWLPDGDRQINITVKRAEQIYGHRRPEPIIKSMVLIESASKSEYPFTVKQINSFTRLEGLDLPMKFKVGDTVSMMCALNNIVTTTIKLIQEKYRTVFDLLES